MMTTSQLMMNCLVAIKIQQLCQKNGEEDNDELYKNFNKALDVSLDYNSNNIE